jgi:UDP-N-acetylmuramoylalanine--D-glutamate ligase
MGLGLNGGGLASARFLAEHGAQVTVTDMKDETALSDSLAALSGLPIRYVLGKHELSDFTAADLVIKNPAVRPDSPYILASKLIETDISLFVRFTNSPIIAVTGSKGKSSVSSAINHILNFSGKKSFLGGNIAVSPLSFIDQCDADTPVVLELSSWQLADMRDHLSLKPYIAVLTSIMPDHMNRYSSMEEYVADKRLIYRNQDGNCFTICNRDESWGKSFAAETKGKVFWYSGEDTVVKGGWLEKSLNGHGLFSMSGDSSDVEKILDSNLLIPGLHQRKNMLAAAITCRLLGISPSDIIKYSSTFPGVEHRLERFAFQEGVSWINDSAATIPQAVEAALKSFTSPIILITGGTDKNIDFDSFGSIYSSAKQIVLLSGSGTDKLIIALSNNGISYLGPYDDFRQAITVAHSNAVSGDIVLLSPGCTSFGMFANEFDRGRKFKEITFSLINKL